MKNFKMPKGRLKNISNMKYLFALCYTAYTATYLGRLNYAACLVEILNTEGWSKSQAGLVATGLFASYGIGKFINGFAGDKISPKYMVSAGLLCSGIINLCFPLNHNVYFAVLLWIINGFFQSMIWSPIIKMLSEWMPRENRIKYCVNMNGTVPVGTLLVYAFSAFTVFIGNWRLSFYTGGLILSVLSVIWFFKIGKFEKELVPCEENEILPGEHSERNISFFKILVASAVPVCCAALFIQGTLKDGVTTWIPTLLEEEFQMTSSAAILSTALVPVLNLVGVYASSWVNRKFIKNEAATGALFFSGAMISLAFLNFDKNGSALTALMLLALATSFMMGINTIIAGVMPSYYADYGICSSVSGILDASVYTGCAFSSYANGAAADMIGWNKIMFFWSILALAGTICCIAAVNKWKNFISKNKSRA